MNQTHFWVTAATGGSYFNPLPKLEGGEREKQGGEEEEEAAARKARETPLHLETVCFNSLQPSLKMSCSISTGRKEAPSVPEGCVEGPAFLHRRIFHPGTTASGFRRRISRIPLIVSCF